MVLVKWDEPQVEEDVNEVEIYRASSESGTYSLIATISAVDGDGNWVTEYDDTSGTESSWYKVRFKNTAGTAGPYSTPRKAGYRPLVTLEDFRALTNFKESEVSDYDFFQMRPKACRAVLDKVAVRVKFEKLSGTIDGSNKEFQTSHKPIADSSLDELYNSADVEVYEASETAEGNLDYGTTTVAVSSIEQFNGIINVSTAPTTGVSGLYANYSFYKKIYSIETLREAAVYYLAYLLSRRLNLENPEQWLNLFNLTLSK